MTTSFAMKVCNASHSAKQYTQVQAQADQWLQYPSVQSGALHLRKLQRLELQDTIDRVGDVWVLQGSMVSLISASHCLGKAERARQRKRPFSNYSLPSVFRRNLSCKDTALQKTTRSYYGLSQVLTELSRCIYVSRSSITMLKNSDL